MTGVSDSDLLSTWSEFLRNALADSKSAGINLTLLPLTSGTSDQDPSIRVCEQSWTAWASFLHSDREIGFSGEIVGKLVLSELTDEAGVLGESEGGGSSLEVSLLVSALMANQTLQERMWRTQL